MTREGRARLNTLKNFGLEDVHVMTDKAYKGDNTRQMVMDLGMRPEQQRYVVWVD